MLNRAIDRDQLECVCVDRLLCLARAHELVYQLEAPVVKPKQRSIPDTQQGDGVICAN